MTYRQAVDYTHTRLRFGMRPGLETISALMARLENPQEKLRVIHVAGTNGKGSTCTMLSNILQAGGYKTGLFLSPYVLDFRERIQVNGAMIPKRAYAALVGELIPQVTALEAEGRIVTEFELLTAAAFLHFQREGCGAVVLETALGGRFDATNVIQRPLCAVITKIALDHMAVLGGSIEQIAMEKCGILKPGCPAVMAPGQDPRAAAVIAAEAKKRGVMLYEPDPAALHAAPAGLDGTQAQWQGQRFLIPLIGAHQVLNAAAAAAAALRCGLGITPGEVAAGIARTRFPARLEVLSRTPPVLLDGAHNPDGARALASAARELFGAQPLTAVLGMLADKDYQSVLALLGPLCGHIVTVRPANPRALSAAALARAARPFCADAVPARSYSAALRLAFEKAAGGPVVIGGSLYLAAAIRQKTMDCVKTPPEK